jgi:hypothetical protein
MLNPDGAAPRPIAVPSSVPLPAPTDFSGSTQKSALSKRSKGVRSSTGVRLFRASVFSRLRRHHLGLNQLGASPVYDLRHNPRPGADSRSSGIACLGDYVAQNAREVAGASGQHEDAPDGVVVADPSPGVEDHAQGVNDPAQEQDSQSASRTRAKC